MTQPIKKQTIFCDLDGTVFIYRKFEELTKTPANKIKSTVDYLISAKNKGAHIVITTARPNSLRGHTINELVENKIPFDQIVMGIERGERILINDNDEGSDIPRAIAIPVKRNEGVPKDKF